MRCSTELFGGRQYVALAVAAVLAATAHRWEQASVDLAPPANCFRVAVSVASGAAWRPQKMRGWRAERESGWISCGTGTCGSSSAASKSCRSAILPWRPAGNSRLPRRGWRWRPDARCGPATQPGPAGLCCRRGGPNPAAGLVLSALEPGVPATLHFLGPLLPSPLAARIYSLRLRR